MWCELTSLWLFFIFLALICPLPLLTSQIGRKINVTQNYPHPPKKRKQNAPFQARLQNKKHTAVYNSITRELNNPHKFARPPLAKWKWAVCPFVTTLTYFLSSGLSIKASPTKTCHNGGGAARRSWRLVAGDPLSCSTTFFSIMIIDAWLSQNPTKLTASIAYRRHPTIRPTFDFDTFRHALKNRCFGRCCAKKIPSTLYQNQRN